MILIINISLVAMQGLLGDVTHSRSFLKLLVMTKGTGYVCWGKGVRLGDGDILVGG